MELDVAGSSPAGRKTVAQLVERQQQATHGVCSRLIKIMSDAV